MPYKHKVGGSNPSSPTMKLQGAFGLPFLLPFVGEPSFVVLCASLVDLLLVGASRRWAPCRSVRLAGEFPSLILGLGGEFQGKKLGMF